MRRADLPSAFSGGDFQSVLEVTDDAGARWLIPVRVAPSEVPGHPHAGLWIGEAVINAVSQPAHSRDAQATRPAGGQFQFRLIVHVDAAGTARLLQHAYLVRKPPTFKPDPEHPGFNILDQPARSIVVTDEALIPEITGSDEIIGRRASSAGFGFTQPVTLTGGEFGSGTLTNQIVLDYNDPLNPFKHIYHPDHNNLDERFEQTLPEGREAFTVKRALRLEFTATDPLGVNPPGWGSTDLGGNYRETITGLHRNTIHVSGNFKLVRVATAVALNE